MSDATPIVRPFLRVVANGVDHEQRLLKLVLVATPEPISDDAAAALGDQAFPLTEWPQRMADLVSKGLAPATEKNSVPIWVKKFTGGAEEKVAEMPVGAFVTAKAGKIGKAVAEDWPKVSTLWRNYIEHGLPLTYSPWRELAEDIRRSLQGIKHEWRNNRSYPTDNVNDQFDKKSGAMLVQPAQPEQKQVIDAVVPVRQSDYAADEEVRRALRILCKLSKEAGSRREESPILKNGDFVQGFKDVVANTAGERRQTSEYSNAVCGALGKCEDKNPSALSLFGSPESASTSIVPAAQTLIEALPSDRATYEYGTWPQDRPPVAGTRDCGPASQQPTANAAETLKLCAEVVRGRYYAAQGDPILSRLFCFSIDLTISMDTIEDLDDPDAGEPVRHILHLLADHTSEPTLATPRVVTAAKFEADAAAAGGVDGAVSARRYRFWPVSIFEAGVGTANDGSLYPISQPEMVEQTNGVWLTGEAPPAGTTAPTARYTLTSLDVRRSVAARSDGVERGERLSTAGVIILDRSRAQQAVRDLVIADHLRKANERKPDSVRSTVYLHAEELAIGRRVDVAAILPGTPIAKAEWRTLGARHVSFQGLDERAALTFRALHGVSPDKGLFSPSYFQTVSRLLPKLSNEPTQAYEAITEEAIFQTDGSPAIVAPHPKRNCDANSERSPFTRVYRPSTTRDGTYAPPAHYYGVPYIYRFSSVFIGGGSPDVDEATCSASACDNVTIPPGIEGVAAPFRFLRHESILSPLVLLPSHLAKMRLLERMGYEQVDQAIVRSGQTRDPIPDTSQSAHTSPVIGLQERLAPSSTIRVFVPPQASLETVQRHRMLDRSKQEDERVLRGGLLDVVWTPVDPAKQDSKPRASGFPTVVTERAQSLTPEKALYNRSILNGDVEDREGGIPVFEPVSGKRPDPAARRFKGTHGYLPDPAISTYSIRARIPGSRRYLSGHESVNLYGDRRRDYPNFLPLVVEIKIRAGLRASPAQNFASIKASPVERRWLSPDGKIGTKAGNGAEVQYLSIALHESEEFELEVACLPSKETLAACFAAPQTMAMLMQLTGQCDKAKASISAVCGEQACQDVILSEPQLATGTGGLRIPSKDEIGSMATRILDCQRDKWAIEEMSAVASLRICHAVNAPSIQPAIGQPVTTAKAGNVWPTWLGTLQEAPERILAFRPADAPPPEGAFPLYVEGSTNLHLAGRVWLDLEQVGAFELRADAVAPLDGIMDNPSRGRSLTARRAGRWPSMAGSDDDPKNRYYVSKRSVLGFDVLPDGRVKVPAETVTILRVDGLPTTGAVEASSGIFGQTIGRLTAVDLGRIFSHAINGGPLPPGLRVTRPTVISDTKARVLKLRLAAIGRHAELFETAPVYLEKADCLLSQRQPLAPHEQTYTSASIDVVVPATTRPVALAVRRPEPAMSLARFAYSNAAEKVETYGVERRATTRIYFKRGQGSSGEGERVGIILWPPSYFDMTEKQVRDNLLPIRVPAVDVGDFEDKDLGPGGAFITRWGGDPIRKDAAPQKGMLIEPQAFGDLSATSRTVHRPAIERKVAIPIPKTPSDPKATGAPAGDSGAIEQDDYLEASLLTFEPCFDIDREEWYVDVDLIPQSASEPFVRFGLVRFQPHGCVLTDSSGRKKDLRCSTPVVVWSQILPKRTLKVEVGSRHHGKVSIRVQLEGFGQLGVKPLDIDKEFPDIDEKMREDWKRNLLSLQRPVMRVAFFHEETSGSGLTHRTNLLAEPSGWQEVEASAPEDRLNWWCQIDVEATRLDALAPGTCTVFVEEVERRMPASYPQEPIAIATLFATSTYRESGPRFSARVPILETHGAYEEEPMK